jgi:Domain of unknown function (DUF4249)
MKKRYLLALTVILGALGCLRETNFEADTEKPDTITVFGTFTNSPEPQLLFITRPNAFNNRQPEPVYDAQAWVVGDDGFRVPYTPQSAVTVLDPAFCYVLPANGYRGKPGGTYYIEIKLSDGSVYRSQPAVMPAPLASGDMMAEGTIDDTTLTSQRKFVEISQRNTVPDNSTYHLRWNIFRVYHMQQFFGDPVPPKTQTFCFVHEFFNQQNVLLGRYQNNGGQTFQQQLARLPLDRKFAVLTYFTAIQYSITPEAYRYWQQVDLVANPQGTVFDAPPAVVKGNLYKQGDANESPLGYFEVASVDTARLRLKTQDLGGEFAPPTYCQYTPPNFTSPGEECFCCLLLPFSQYKAPWYWVP